MLDGSGTSVDAPLEDIAFLSRSSNRFRVLDALSTDPQTRRELETEVDASRPTLQRILADFTDRGWVERTADNEYAPTAKGEHIVARFAPLVEAMRAVQRLDEAVAWLPTGEHAIDVEHFSDATVRRSTPTSPIAAADYLAEVVPNASRFTCLAHIAPPVDVSATLLDSVLDGQLTAEMVFTDDLVEYLLTKPDRTARWRRHLENGTGVFRYPGYIPCNLFIVDDTVFVGNSHPEVDQACQLIESRDDAVEQWAQSVIESHRTEADRLDTETFTDGS